ncbi:hypothetical protein NBRC110019_30890 [Neptunitalea chrysea]|uniref:DUF4249 domain-containing protein n=1 Tax=Neptunitalea chrysea TaxID=1647581 RepID=A0A9W6B7I4_9FLAO|nr:DUF4249 family protein [Neptunitalea chrysea]GLB54048.1 hypothetical protein NBRC110019_30890 [Neptunitalea chrysea]
MQKNNTIFYYILYVSKYFILLSFLLFCNSCTEAYQINYSETYEDLIVVEAIITNELKHQEITLTKTFQIDEIFDEYIPDANVYVSLENGSTYDFYFNSETNTYLSEIEFQAEPDINYQLHINYNNTLYESTIVKMAPIAEVTDIKFERETIDSEDGVSIRLNTDSPNSKLLRYEYEETYKHITPYGIAEDLDVQWVPIPGFDFLYKIRLTTVPKTEQTQICYITKNSDNIILNSFNNTQTSSTINDALIKFIPVTNYIISSRYAIKVKQYVHNTTAYSFYQNLKKISESNSSLSPIQPGYIVGNIVNQENSSDKIMGIFDVASVSSSERIFFNYADLFPDEELPQYFTECNITPLNINPENPGDDNTELLLIYLDQGNMAFYHLIEIVPESSWTVYMMPTECIDCTYFDNSATTPPDFWIE